MSSHNFWNNFSYGFLNGMFNSNPFIGFNFGCCGGFSCFNSCFHPFFNCFSTFSNANLYLYPNVMSTANFFPLMPDMAVPSFDNVKIDVNELFPTDKWQKPLDNNFLMGDVFEKTSNNNSYTPLPYITTADYNFTFAKSKTEASKKTEISKTTKKTKRIKRTETTEITKTTKTTKTTETAKTSNKTLPVVPAITPDNTEKTSLASLKSKHWTEMTDVEMRQVYGNYTRDITTPYKGTAADLNKYLEGKGVLSGQGQAFLEAQQKYGISASVLVGIAMNESGQGTSSNAINKKNIGGVRISGSTAFRIYNSVAECIDDMARFLQSGYVNNKSKSLTKLYQINAKYCPSSDPTDTDNVNALWARNVNKYAGEVESARV